MKVNFQKLQNQYGMQKEKKDNKKGNYKKYKKCVFTVSLEILCIFGGYLETLRIYENFRRKLQSQNFIGDRASQSNPTMMT